MLEEHLSRIFSALEAEGVRYLVVGGLAVVAHGHARFTADLDLVIALDAANVRATLAALQSLGYVPRAPVSPECLADVTMRELWIREKAMTVFQMFSDWQPETAVDIFIQEPFDFRREYEEAPRLELVERKRVPVIRFEALLAMKRSAGRPPAGSGRYSTTGAIAGHGRGCLTSGAIDVRSTTMPKPTPPVGSFEDAARANARRIAALTPAERVRIVCSMQKIVTRVRAKRPGKPHPDLQRGAADRVRP